MLWAHCSAHHHCAVMVIHLFHLFFDDRFHQHLGPDDVIPSKAWGTVYFKNGLDSKRTSTEVGYEHRNHERQTDRQTLKRRKAEQKQRHHPRVTCIHGNRFVFLLTHTRTSTHTLTHLRTYTHTHTYTHLHTFSLSPPLLPLLSLPPAAARSTWPPAPGRVPAPLPSRRRSRCRRLCAACARRAKQRSV